MVVSIVLDTEYMGVAERNKWFLKVVSNAIKEDTLIVTHSYFKDHLVEVIESCQERFYNQFEMDHVSAEQIQKLDVCYIPDEWMDSIYYKCGSRTKQIINLYNNNNLQIERYIENSIDEALKKRNEDKPEFIYNCLHVFEFVREISVHYECPIIPWVFSAVRKVHGYTQTLYMAHIGDNLFNSDACLELYAQSENENNSIPLFSKKEILAILGKKHNMVLLPLIDKDGFYDVGVVGEGFHITPEIYQKDSVTDDDIYYESKRLFDVSNIVSRQHPIQLDQSGIGRKHMKNDPASFILSCKRVVTVQSQMIIKAAIWNRAPITMSDALPYSFLLNKEMRNATPINDYSLNFILFVYFIPDVCMFSTEYWRWRKTKPSIVAIARRHLEAILKSVSIPFNIVDNNEHRLETLLSYRGFSDDEISRLVSSDMVDDVPIDYPSSYMNYITNNGKEMACYCLNHLIDNDTLVSKFNLPADCLECSFVPQNDWDGYITVDKFCVNDKELSVDVKKVYYNKNQPVVKVILDSNAEYQIIVHWHIKRVVE